MVDVSRLCMGCMEERESSGGRCSRCGYEDGAAPPDRGLSLAPRTELQGQYLVGRVLGHGGFGITYLGWDLHLERKVAVKEYLPAGLALRGGNGGEVSAASSEVRKDFDYGLERFLDEARTVARFQAVPAIVSVLNFFRANGTAYLVMEYLDGVTLERYVEQMGGKLSIDVVLSVMGPVMEAMELVHKQGLLHRDLTPDNIYITRKGQVKVLDFGAARYALGQQSRNLSVILKEGFAPVEQYHSKGNQGPWTDVYGCAATMYKALTGKMPQGALDRMHGDELVRPSALGVALSGTQEAALLRALAVQPEPRFHSMDAFRQALTGEGGAAVADPPGVLPDFVETGFLGTGRSVSGRPLSDRPVSLRLPSAQPAPPPPAPAPPAPATFRLPKWVWPAGALMLVLFALGGYKQYQDGQTSERAREQDQSSRARLQEELRRQRLLDEENAKRNKQRQEDEQVLSRQEEELRKQREALDRQQPPAQKGQPAAPPPVPTPSGPTYEELLRKAQEAVKARQYPVAIQLSRQAVAANGRRPEAYANLGWALLYGTSEVEEAGRQYRAAIEHGGTVWFRVYHDHGGGSFSDRCMGDLGVARETVQFVVEGAPHQFQTPRASIREVRENRSPLRGGNDFRIQLNDGRSYNMLSVTNPKAIRTLILELLR